MITKENVNMKQREVDFKGLLDEGEMEAQLQFKDQEITAFRLKLEEERAKNNDHVSELKEEI